MIYNEIIIIGKYALMNSFHRDCWLQVYMYVFMYFAFFYNSKGGILLIHINIC